MPLHARSYKNYRPGQWVVVETRDLRNNKLTGRYGQVTGKEGGWVIVRVTNLEGLRRPGAHGFYRCRPHNILPLDNREKAIAKAEFALFNRRQPQ